MNNNKKEVEFNNFDAMKNKNDFQDFGAVNDKRELDFNNFFKGDSQLGKRENKAFDAKFSDDLDFFPNHQTEKNYNPMKNEAGQGFGLFGSNPTDIDKIGNQNDDIKGASRNLFERNDFFDDQAEENDISHSIATARADSKQVYNNIPVERPRISDNNSFEKEKFSNNNDKIIRRAVDFEDIQASNSELGINHSKASFKEIFDDNNSARIDPKSILERLGRNKREDFIIIKEFFNLNVQTTRLCPCPQKNFI
jgi:hypothetical protein